MSAAQMDVTVNKKQLVLVLNQVKHTIGGKRDIAIFSHVLLVAGANNQLHASTRCPSWSVSTTAFMLAETQVPGSLAVPIKDLLACLKGLPDGAIQLSSVGTSVLLVQATPDAMGHRSEIRIIGCPASDFPVLPSSDTASESVSAEVLGDVLDRTHFAISTDEARPHLNSALVEFGSDTIRIVTTDGHRLSLYETAHGNEQIKPRSFLLPLRGIKELRRMCATVRGKKRKSSDAPIHMMHGQSHAFFMRGNLVLAIRLVDARFPSYENVIPKWASDKINVNRQAFLALAHQALVVAKDRFSARIEINKGTFRVSSTNPDAVISGELPVNYTSVYTSIQINARYLVDALEAIDEEEIKFSFSGKVDPVVIEPVSDRKHKMVIMPIRPSATAKKRQAA